METRKKWQQIAEETLKISKNGSYIYCSNEVDISGVINHSASESTLYTPAQTEELLQSLMVKPEFKTDFKVVNETTIKGARRLLATSGMPIIALNFASAKNPGGGFLKGSQAQEESLARSSALYETLKRHNEMYEHNRSMRSGLYSDYMIYSPDVPVFRNDKGDLLSKPFLLSMITAPAVNASALSKRGNAEELNHASATLEKRIEKILALALNKGYKHIVLGAYGCGVFGNSPAEVARIFKSVLVHNPMFVNRFKCVLFSVLDNSKTKSTISFFEREFHSTPANKNP